jgi:hypothetical protein
MKKHLIILLLSATTLFAVAQKSEKEPFMVKSFSNQNISNATVETSGGSISVLGVEPGEARVEVFISPNGGREHSMTKEEIQQRLDEMYVIKVELSGGKLLAKAEPKENIRDWKKALNISFKLYVPKTTTTDLSTSGGSIYLAQLNGKHDFTTSGGSLHVDHVSGKINGRTSGGSIDVENSKDDIDLATSGGSIDARNCEGRLRLTTSGGSLQLSGLKGDIRATTSGGGINGKNIEGELITSTSGGSIHLSDLMCSIDASTSGGGISVSIKELGKYVKLRNSAGNIDLELPKNKGIDLDLSAQRVRVDKMEGFSGTINDDEIEGKLNGGGVPVTVKSSAGRISLGLK